MLLSNIGLLAQPCTSVSAWLLLPRCCGVAAAPRARFRPHLRARVLCSDNGRRISCKFRQQRRRAAVEWRRRTAAAGGGEEEEGHMMDSECTPLHNLELAFIFWEKDQQDWIWHRAASTKKSQLKWGHNQSAKGQSLGTSARVRSQLICMQVKWHASANLREKIMSTP